MPPRQLSYIIYIFIRYAFSIPTSSEEEDERADVREPIVDRRRSVRSISPTHDPLLLLLCLTTQRLSLLYFLSLCTSRVLAFEARVRQSF